jgi:hypothetical protein
MMIIDPRKIEFGQTPESQFPAKRFHGGDQDGDWDLKLVTIESHPLYRSYVEHFLEGKPWENTPFFQFALTTIKTGKPFRGRYTNLESLLQRFEKCDALYRTIEKHGYKSNHQLYNEGLIDNILELRDEVTVNISRDGTLILNDGWHRFSTVRMLGFSELPVRICAVHEKYEKKSDL